MPGRRRCAVEPEQTTGLLVDAKYNWDLRNLKRRVLGFAAVRIDRNLGQESKHLFLVKPLKKDGEKELRLMSRCWPEAEVFIGTRRQIFERIIRLAQGRLMVSHGLHNDQAVLQHLAEKLGIGYWKQPFPGLDTMRLEQSEDRLRKNSLAAAYARISATAWPKCALSDAIKALAVAQKHGGTLETLQSLARQQMNARRAYLDQHPLSASRRKDSIGERMRRKARRRFRSRQHRQRSSRSARPRRGDASHRRREKSN